jgi:hypothetical protein
MKRLALAGLMLLLLASCESEILPTQVHTATTPAMVKVYQDPPKRYEVLGTVSMAATAENPWEDHADVDAGIELLKVGAAKIGANGMLLKHPAHKDMLSCKYLGKTRSISIERTPQRTVYAQPIYVIEEW